MTDTAGAVAVDGPLNAATAPAPLVVVDGRLRLVTDSLLRALRRNPGEVVVRPAATDRHRRSKAQLELRRLLLEAVGCADRLSQAQREVLVLRVGGGPQRPLSRAQVADRLDLSRRVVVRVERSVRQDLRRLAGEQACAPAVTTEVAGGPSLAAAGAAAAGAGAASQEGGPDGGAGGAARAGVNEVAGATENGGTTTRTASSGVAADRHESTGPVLETPLGTVDLFPNGTLGTALAVAGVAGLAGLLASLLVGAARRRRRRAA